MFEVVYLKEAQENIEGFPREIAKRILDKIDFYSAQKEPKDYAKALSGTLKSYYRFRIGDYRVVVRFEPETLLVVRVMHRREVYR